MYSQTESLTWQIGGVLHTAMSTETELQRQNERLELPLNRMGHENREMGTRYAKQLIESIPWGKEWAEKVGLGFKLPGKLSWATWATKTAKIETGETRLSD